jgi:Yeast PIR protein repeat
MQFSTVLLGLGAAALASAGAVTSQIYPTGAAPAGCTGSYDGQFEITIVRPAGTTKREEEKRAACAGTGTLVIQLQNGVLTDADGRTGYIASNYQFQFDKPPQAGAIFTSGFSVCSNTSLALGDSAVFYQCQSGGFYNLYNKHWAAQCQDVAIDIVACGGGSGTLPSAGSSPASSPAAGGSSPAPAAGTTPAAAGTPPPAATTPAIMVSQFTDGQPQVPTALVSQITDGQPQAPSAAPAPSIAQGAGAVFGVAQEVVLAAAGLVGAALL